MLPDPAAVAFARGGRAAHVPLPPPPQPRPTDLGTAWLLLRPDGSPATRVAVDRLALGSALRLAPRDVRLLDPQVAASYPSAVLARGAALLLRLEHVQAIVTRGWCLLAVSSFLVSGLLARFFFFSLPLTSTSLSTSQTHKKSKKYKNTLGASPGGGRGSQGRRRGVRRRPAAAAPSRGRGRLFARAKRRRRLWGRERWHAAAAVCSAVVDLFIPPLFRDDNGGSNDDRRRQLPQQEYQ